MDNERRAMPRFPVNLTINKVNNQPLFGRIKDFSRKGMRVVLNTPVFNDQSDIQIEIQRPDYNEQISVTAFVAWKKTFENKSEAGLRFKNIPVQAKADFLDYSYKGWLREKLHH